MKYAAIYSKRHRMWHGEVWNRNLKVIHQTRLFVRVEEACRAARLWIESK